MDMNAVHTVQSVAWLHWRSGKVLCVRSKGKDKFYIPGGKYEEGESDVTALAREIKEELGVKLVAESAKEVITIRAPAHGYSGSTKVAMKCFEASCAGILTTKSEIAELAWLSFEERDKCAPAAKLAIEYLQNAGHLKDGFA